MKTTTSFQKPVIVMLMLLLSAFYGFAFDYIITFSGSGSSTVIDNVEVQNITKGTTVTVPGEGVLHLQDAPSSVNSLESDENFITLYPNPLIGSANLSFYALQAGNTQLTVSDLTGRIIIDYAKNLPEGKNAFQLTLPKGVFLIQVAGNGFNYNLKAISFSEKTVKPQLMFAGFAAQKSQKSKTAGIYMLYSAGDLLVYKATSGGYVTVITDSPTGDKTTNFDFVECKDGSGNNYPVVRIGTQLWMAKNLNTTKYQNGEDIPYISDANDWKYAYAPALCNHSNDVNNGDKYGKLYNYYAVSDSRKLAPAGWHVATKDEWNTLVTYVDTHWGFIVKPPQALSANTDWIVTLVDGQPVCNPNLNNFSGFSALPGGDRGGFFNGTFFNLGGTAFWWTSTENSIQDAWYHYFSYDGFYTILDYNKKQYGLSVRCVKD